MANATTTPRTKSATDPTTPVGSRLTTSAVSALHSSPHYATTRRHSLYGTEDRIIIDPGSRVWKVGFSGEGRPREVFFAENGDRTSLWNLTREPGSAEREEEDRMLKVKLQDRLRKVFHEILLTDPKSRKVIIVEHPFLPLYIKDMMASVLFDNLQIPSLSFVSNHLLALLAVGRMTGLVLDCGYLESTVLPIFASRPLSPQLKTTPLAGSRFASHLRALVLMFSTYIPPLTTLGGAANIPVASRSMRVPEEVLTDAVMEDIKARCCFVGEMIDSETHVPTSFVDDGSTEPEVPPSDSSQPELESGVNTPASPPSSRLSSVTSPSGLTSLTRALSQAGTGLGSGAAAEGFDRASGERHLQAIASMYSRYSTATDLLVRVDPPPSQNTGTGQGTLRIPGWVRERAAEVLFEGGDVDEGSVAEVILDALLRVPVDLRRTLAGSILVVGGTAMLPGFIPRLHNELVRLLTREPHQSNNRSSPPRAKPNANRPSPPPYDPYSPLRPLAPYISILNNPSPPQSDPSIPTNAGKAPAFTPAMLPWVGGSLAGAMKITGAEISREKWDEAEAGEEEMEDEDLAAIVSSIPTKRPGFHLPDWTRALLPPGAPPAPRPPRIEVTSVQMDES